MPTSFKRFQLFFRSRELALELSDVVPNERHLQQPLALAIWTRFALLDDLERSLLPLELRV